MANNTTFSEEKFRSRFSYCDNPSEPQAMVAFRKSKKYLKDHGKTFKSHFQDMEKASAYARDTENLESSNVQLSEIVADFEGKIRRLEKEILNKKQEKQRRAAQSAQQASAKSNVPPPPRQTVPPSAPPKRTVQQAVEAEAKTLKTLAITGLCATVGVIGFWAYQQVQDLASWGFTYENLTKTPAMSVVMDVKAADTYRAEAKEGKLKPEETLHAAMDRCGLQNVNCVHLATLPAGEPICVVAVATGIKRDPVDFMFYRGTAEDDVKIENMRRTYGQGVNMKHFSFHANHECNNLSIGLSLLKKLDAPFKGTFTPRTDNGRANPPEYLKNNFYKVVSNDVFLRSEKDQRSLAWLEYGSCIKVSPTSLLGPQYVRATINNGKRSMSGVVAVEEKTFERTSQTQCRAAFTTITAAARDEKEAPDVAATFAPSEQKPEEIVKPAEVASAPQKAASFSSSAETQERRRDINAVRQRTTVFYETTEKIRLVDDWGQTIVVMAPGTCITVKGPGNAPDLTEIVTAYRDGKNEYTGSLYQDDFKPSARCSMNYTG